MPPGTLRSRSFILFTMRVGLPHLGQSVLLDVSIIFLRSAVLATLAMFVVLSVNGSRGVWSANPQQCSVELPGRKAET